VLDEDVDVVDGAEDEDKVEDEEGAEDEDKIEDEEGAEDEDKVEDEEDEEGAEELLSDAAWYTFSRSDPPQYSEALPLQIILHPLVAGTLPPGAIVAPAPKVFPQ
jgi:hypothetical protein